MLTFDKHYVSVLSRSTVETIGEEEVRGHCSVMISNKLCFHPTLSMPADAKASRALSEAMLPLCASETMLPLCAGTDLLLNLRSALLPSACSGK